MNCFKQYVFNFKNFKKNFREHVNMENLDYVNKNIERKYSKYAKENSKKGVKIDLELEKIFIELKDG